MSIHKAQGSEFGHTFVIIPASGKRPVSAELVYTALARANRHCTLLLESDVTSLLDARRRENAQTPQINSSLFDLHVAKTALRDRNGWYESGKIHEALSGDMLRSKSEVIIANLFHERQIPFRVKGLSLSANCLARPLRSVRTTGDRLDSRANITSSKIRSLHALSSASSA